VSRREFWQRIHDIASEGTSVMVTTHYMDEAERCHRLAFIFRGAVLDLGTPQEVLARRGLRVAELIVDDAAGAAAALAGRPEVDEVAHFGHVLRVAVRGMRDPVAFCTDALSTAGVAIASGSEARANVEDAFVSMVREDG
jgi:ABC-2 type transport system ATP-binding protein